MAPSWKQFSRLAFTPEVAAVLKALDLEVPAEGRPSTFRSRSLIINRLPNGQWVVCRGMRAQPALSGREVLRLAQLSAGTSTGDALRQWLRWWGWMPKSEQAPAEPQEQTRMVT